MTQCAGAALRISESEKFPVSPYVVVLSFMVVSGGLWGRQNGAEARRGWESRA